MKPCKFCGGEGEQSLLVAFCKKCGARTINFTAMGGDYQTEERMAESAWNRGDYEGGRPVIIYELQALRGAMVILSAWQQSGEDAAAMARETIKEVQKTIAGAVYK